MRYQVHTFIKQVHVDLLALSDADLLRTIDQWVLRKEPFGSSQNTPEDTWSALGYTHIPTETEHLSGTIPEAGPEAQQQWLPPSPDHLRKLLTEMDMKQFAQHIIAIAFQSLHATYPEWGEGSTFNAHLANHLRWIRTNQPRNVHSTRGTPRL